MKQVIVVPYDIKWKTDFIKIKGELLTALKDLIIGIEHVGSTAVEGLSSKPCIDIDVIIKDYSNFDEVRTSLESIGYIYEGDLGIQDRIAFTYIDKPHLQKHHLYVCPIYSVELKRHLKFRDYLRINEVSRNKYEQTKIEASHLFPNDIDKYIEYKSIVINEIYKKIGLE